ncbi:MAG TPA: restriction endonuclease subunit S [Candidatus Micrarchaeaceae archaeon]|nr:restriction endonuclease subunit S [Candidatus Micrarchaeaceae archaeon]
MNDWPIVRLGEVAQCLDVVRRPVRAADRHPGPYPYYGASGIIDHVDAYLLDGTYTLVAEDGENLRSRNTPIAFLARGKFWVNNHAHVLAGDKETDTRYLAYLIEERDVAGYLSGSTQPKLTQQALLAMTVPLPPVPVQRAISEVLGALDDKIEVNRSVGNRAERLALQLPSLTERTTSVGAVARNAHRTVPTSYFSGKEVEHFSLPAFDTGQLPLVQAGDEIKSAKCLLEEPTVLISKLNPHIPRVWMATPGGAWLAVTSTEFVGLTPASAYPTEVLWALCASDDFQSQLLERVKGTTGSHQRVSREDILALRIPDPDAMDGDVGETITYLVRLAGGLRRESARLASLRDTLLPRLLSGEVRVRNAGALVEETV